MRLQIHIVPLSALQRCNYCFSSGVSPGQREQTIRSLKPTLASCQAALRGGYRIGGFRWMLSCWFRLLLVLLLVTHLPFECFHPLLWLHFYCICFITSLRTVRCSSDQLITTCFRWFHYFLRRVTEPKFRQRHKSVKHNLSICVGSFEDRGQLFKASNVELLDRDGWKMDDSREWRRRRRKSFRVPHTWWPSSPTTVHLARLIKSQSKPNRPRTCSRSCLV